MPVRWNLSSYLLLSALILLVVATSESVGHAHVQLDVDGKAEFGPGDRGRTSAQGTSQIELQLHDWEVKIGSISTGRNDLKELTQVVDVLQTEWYQLWLGTWPTSIDWTGAVLNTHLIAALGALSKAMRKSDHRSTTANLPSENDIDLYFSQTTAYYFGEDAASLRRQAYDDMLWVVLSWLESINFIKAHARLHHDELWHGMQFVDVFAHRAQDFYNLTTQGWSNELCDGGMIWNPQFEPYKNAVTNQLFIAASVGMYLYYPSNSNHSFSSQSHFKFHDRRLLDAAVHGYDWLKSSNMTNNHGLYVDGFHISGWHRNSSNTTHNTACDARNEMVYTYNQGVLLSALRGLWQATGDAAFLDDGHELVKNTIAATGWDLHLGRQFNTSAWQGLGRNGILEELCDSSASCSQDAHTFKSIYFHHLTSFCANVDRAETIPDEVPFDDRTAAKHRKMCLKYTPWVRHNARAAMSARDKYGRVGTWWGAGNIMTAFGDNLPDSPPGDMTVPLPDGAVDYRSDRKAMGKMQHRSSIEKGRRSHSAKHASAKKHAANAQRLMLGHHAQGKGDWNDRGRGRTVESHAGGVAVLRCLWEFEQL